MVCPIFSQAGGTAASSECISKQFLMHEEVIYASEQSFIKVSLEEIKTQTKQNQRTLEKELSLILAFFNSKATSQSTKENNNCATIEATCEILQKAAEAAKKRLFEVKEKFQADQQVIEESFSKLQNRVDVYDNAINNCMKEDTWNELRIDRLLNDYFLRSAYMKSSEMLVNSKPHLAIFSDTRLYKMLNSIETKIVNENDLTDCLAWIADNRIHLKKMESSLEFGARLQEFIEIARKRQLKDCLGYAKKTLSGFIEHHMLELQQIMGLLAIPPATDEPSYQKLYSPERWLLLARQFRHDFYALHSLQNTSPLLLAVQAGLAAIKTYSCHEKLSSDAKTASGSCPCCCGHLGELAIKLPVSHHENSRIVCRLTGSLIDDKNYALILPNGSVYSYNGLKNHGNQAEISRSKITCVRTGEEFDMGQAKKCFLTS